MIIGMSMATFTLVHVVLSLIGIFTGTFVSYDMLNAKIRGVWTSLFLVTTLATSATGFLFHSTSFGPAHVIGVISLVVLATTMSALYVYHLAGAWRWAYVIGAVIALYANVFVCMVQAFQKLPLLKVLAPTQSEPPFVIAQALVLVVFVALGVLASRRFRPAMPKRRPLAAAT